MHIHQNNIMILNKPEPQLFIANGLSRLHNKGKDKVLGTSLNINAVETCKDMMADEITCAMQDDHLSALSNCARAQSISQHVDAR